MIKGKNRVTVFCPPGMESFVTPIIGELRQYFNIYLFNGGHEYEFNEAMKHSNVGWFEWAVEHLVSASNYSKCCKMITRMHSFEAFTDFPAQVNWNNIDRLIIPNISVFEVNEFYKGFVVDKLAQEGKVADINEIPPHIPNNIISVIANPVDVSKFTFAKKHDYKKKICFVGHINFKKNFEYALNLFHELKLVDSEFTLHIAGDFQEPRHALYLDKFLKNNKYQLNKDIYMYGWISNVHEFYQDMDFIISSSLYESFHLSIMEAMSVGVIPLIYSWHGAEYIYPKEFIFNDVSSFIKLISAVQNDKNFDGIRKLLSGHVKKNFSYEVVLPQFKSLLDYMCYGDIVKEYIDKNNISDLSKKENIDNIALGTKLDTEEVINCSRGLSQDLLYGGEICAY